MDKDGDQGGWFCAIRLERQGSAQPNQIHTQPQAAPRADPWPSPFNLRVREQELLCGRGVPQHTAPPLPAASVSEGRPGVSLPYSVSLRLSFLECSEWTITASTWPGAVERSLHRERRFRVSRWPRCAPEGARRTNSGPAQLPRTGRQLRSERRGADRPPVSLFPVQGR